MISDYSTYVLLGYEKMKQQFALQNQIRSLYYHILLHVCTITICYYIQEHAFAICYYYSLSLLHVLVENI